MSFLARTHVREGKVYEAITYWSSPNCYFLHVQASSLAYVRGTHGRKRFSANVSHYRPFFEHSKCAGRDIHLINQEE